MARFDPIKNHENLFAAIKTIKNNIPISLSLFGEKITNDNEDLKVLIKKYSLNQEIKLEGVDPMLRDKFSNYDLLALPSTKFGSNNIIVNPKNLAPIIIGIDIYPPIEITFLIFSFFK